MNNLRMKWKSKGKGKGKTKHPENINCRLHPPVRAATGGRPYMSDERLELLANRYLFNRICYLLDITFEAYLLAPEGWDRIAKHLEDGGGCRMVAGELIPNEVRHA